MSIAERGQGKMQKRGGSMRHRWQATAGRTVLASVALAAALAGLSLPAAAQFTDPLQNIGVRPELLKDVGIDQKLDEPIPLTLAFRDEHGNPVELSPVFRRAGP